MYVEIKLLMNVSPLGRKFSLLSTKPLMAGLTADVFKVLKNAIDLRQFDFRSRPAADNHFLSVLLKCSS